MNQGFSDNTYGGGFQNDYNNSPTNSPSQSKTKKSGTKYQSLFPVTIKQLLNAQQSQPDDSFRIDNHELQQVTIVANILSIADQSTHLSVMVDDGTGKIDVRFFHHDNHGNQGFTDQQQRALPWKEGNYVRIIGHLRSFAEKKSLVAYRISPIEKMNEITYHLLECISVHLQHTRGPLPDNMTGITATTSAPYHTNNQYNAYQHPFTGGRGGIMSELQSAILQVIKAAGSTSGASVLYMSQQLHQPEQEIRRAVEWLSNEGHLYSTIDDDHFQVIDERN